MGTCCLFLYFRFKLKSKKTVLNYLQTLKCISVLKV